MRSTSARKQRDEITHRALTFGVQPVDETGEKRARSAAAPGRRFEEFWSRGNEHQPLDTRWKRGGEIERQLTAKRPAEQRVSLGERSERLVYAPGLGRGRGGARIPVAAPVAGQIEGNHPEAWREHPHQAIPHPEVQTPAMQQHEVAGFAATADFVVERAHVSRAPRAATGAPELLGEPIDLGLGVRRRERDA